MNNPSSFLVSNDAFCTSQPENLGLRMERHSNNAYTEFPEKHPKVDTLSLTMQFYCDVTCTFLVQVARVYYPGLPFILTMK